MTLAARAALTAWRLALLLSARAAADEPPEIPVGLDAYLWVPKTSSAAGFEAKWG